jgi:hypothetical protein
VVDRRESVESLANSAEQHDRNADQSNGQTYEMINMMQVTSLVRQSQHTGARGQLRFLRVAAGLQGWS